MYLGKRITNKELRKLVDGVAILWSHGKYKEAASMARGGLPIIEDAIESEHREYRKLLLLQVMQTLWATIVEYRDMAEQGLALGIYL